MKIVTWNINSVRARLPSLLALDAALQPDVICLQETKAENSAFPLEAIMAAGYPHLLSHGMKAYNGVAILSRMPMTRLEVPEWCGKADCRHIAARLDNGIEVHNFYVPAGGDVPDPEVNPKFAHKLEFLDSIAAWFAGHTSGTPRILLGDLNVAPLPEDVWSHRIMSRIISHTPIEVEHLARLQASAGWVDALRVLTPPPEKLFTWWSYRAGDWEVANRGLRLDHLWLSPGLAPKLVRGGVMKEVRRLERPSDHAPVWVELDLL